jgi:outer membrane protein assembly factor BamB
MKKIFFTILIPLVLSSCDHIGSSRVKNLIDLTPKLEVDSNEKVVLSDAKKNPFSNEKIKSYKIAGHSIIAQPAIAKNIIYSVDSKGNVSAFSLKENKIIWITDIAKGTLDRSFNTGGILYSDEKLFVTNGSRNLVILDAKNGDEIIRKEFPDILRVKPVMADDRILLVQTISNQLLAYDIKSSNLIWMHEGGIETISSQNNIAPVINNNHALVSYSSGEVIYLDIKSGKEKWIYNLATAEEVGMPSFDPALIVTAPIISGNYAYFATSNSKVLKIHLEDGITAWQKQADDVQSISLFGDNLFITNNARQIAALSTHTGKVKWTGNLISEEERKTKRPQPVIFQTPFVSTIDNNGIAVNVVASNGVLYQFVQDKNCGLPLQPKIVKIEKQVRYQWLSCCTGKLHLITAREIKF